MHKKKINPHIFPLSWKNIETLWKKLAFKWQGKKIYLSKIGNIEKKVFQKRIFFQELVLDCTVLNSMEALDEQNPCALGVLGISKKNLHFREKVTLLCSWDPKTGGFFLLPQGVWKTEKDVSLKQIQKSFLKEVWWVFQERALVFWWGKGGKTWGMFLNLIPSEMELLFLNEKGIPFNRTSQRKVFRWDAICYKEPSFLEEKECAFYTVFFKEKVLEKKPLQLKSNLSIEDSVLKKQEINQKIDGKMDQKLSDQVAQKENQETDKKISFFRKELKSNPGDGFLFLFKILEKTKWERVFSQIRHELQKREKKTQKRKSLVVSSLKEAHLWKNFKKQADLLKGSLHLLEKKKFDGNVLVFDFLKNKKVEVFFPQLKTPQDQMNIWYRKAQKLFKREKKLSETIVVLEKEGKNWKNFQIKLDQVEQCFQKGEKGFENTLEKLLIALKAGREEKKSSCFKKTLQKSRKQIGRRFDLLGKFLFVLGRSQKENQLLLQQARAWDVWIHLRERASAHGILFLEKSFWKKVFPKKKEKVSEREKQLFLKALKEAGKKLVSFSVKNPVGTYELMWTRRTFVKPLKGEKWRVRYEREKVFTVTFLKK